MNHISPTALAPVRKTPNLRRASPRFSHRQPGTPTLRDSPRVSAKDPLPLASSPTTGIYHVYITMIVVSSLMVDRYAMANTSSNWLYMKDLCYFNLIFSIHSIPNSRKPSKFLICIFMLTVWRPSWNMHIVQTYTPVLISVHHALVSCHKLCSCKSEPIVSSLLVYLQ